MWCLIWHERYTIFCASVSLFHSISVSAIFGTSVFNYKNERTSVRLTLDKNAFCYDTTPWLTFICMQFAACIYYRMSAFSVLLRGSDIISGSYVMPSDSIFFFSKYSVAKNLGIKVKRTLPLTDVHDYHQYFSLMTCFTCIFE